VMQSVISSQSTPQNSFPYPRWLAFHTSDINHAEFGEPIWSVRVGCILSLLCAELQEEAAMSQLNKIGHNDKERNQRLFNRVISCTFVTRPALRLKLQTATPYLRHFLSKLIPFSRVNKTFSYKVNYWTKKKKILFHHVIRKLLLGFPVSWKA
jgi:hypothetical protein